MGSIEKVEKLTWTIENFSEWDHSEEMYSETFFLSGLPYMVGTWMNEWIPPMSCALWLDFHLCLYIILCFGHCFYIRRLESLRKKEKNTCQFICLLGILLICLKGGADLQISSCLLLIKPMAKGQLYKVFFTLLSLPFLPLILILAISNSLSFFFSIYIYSAFGFVGFYIFDWYIEELYQLIDDLH